MIFVVISVLV